MTDETTAPALEPAGDIPDRPRRGRPPVQSRGRPADPALAESLTVEGETRMTRRPRSGDSANPYEIPPEMKKPGWDYEWKMHNCLGMPESASGHLKVHEGGWRPVLGRDMKKMVPPGGDLSKQIERDGLGLYTRPQYLTDEAKEEDYRIAQEQQSAKLATAHTNISSDPRMPAFVDKMEIQGEIGSTRTRG